MADESPLKWWEESGTRRAVAFSFCAALLLGHLALLPDVNRLYEAYPAIKHVIEALIGISGLLLAALELMHSDEANQHRAERNHLARQEITLNTENQKLHQQTLELQREIHELQREIEQKLTKVRLYARAQKSENGIAVQLLLSNLSDFDLWTNQVRLVVTESLTAASPGTYFIGGGKRISRGHTEDGYLLHGTILKANQDQGFKVELKFYVQVEAVGVSDKPVTVESPEYEFKQLDGRVVKLEVLRYPPFAVSPDAGGSAP
jgi:hypothetical protein